MNKKAIQTTQNSSFEEKEILYIFAPDGLTAIYETKNGESKMYFTSTDHLGSINLIVDASNGNVVDDLSYDAWGRNRNPVNWTYSNITLSSITDRGYTSHEQLTNFGLINMNGRIYDPMTMNFLSPDPILQNPSNSQNYNRYSYCLNNPLKYVDPSGHVFLDPWYEYMAGPKTFRTWLREDVAEYNDDAGRKWKNIGNNINLMDFINPNKSVFLMKLKEDTEFDAYIKMLNEKYPDLKLDVDMVWGFNGKNLSDFGDVSLKRISDVMDKVTSPYIGLGVKLTEDFGDDIARGLGGTGKTVGIFLGPVSDIWGGYNIIKTANNPNISNPRKVYDIAKNGIPISIDVAIMLGTVESNPAGWIATGIGVTMEGAELFYDEIYTPTMNYLLDYSNRWDTWFINGGYNNFYSDLRLKTEIVEVDSILNKLELLKTYNFRWRKDTTFMDIGLLAQEVERVFPEMIILDSVGYKQIAYHKLVPLLLQAIKEQNVIIKQQNNSIEKQESLINAQLKILNNISERLKKIEKEK